MYKLLHIHNDPKFIYFYKNYINEKFENELLFFGDLAMKETRATLEESGLKYFFLSPLSNIQGIEHIIKSGNYNGLVFYGQVWLINLIEQELLNKLKVFLRVFGYEFYNLKILSYLHKSTIDILKKDCPPAIRKPSIINWLKREKDFRLRFPKYNKKKYKDIFSRIDALIIKNYYEYKHLEDFFYIHKEYIQHVLPEYQPINQAIKKGNLIIIGNSRSIVNNHLEIAELLNNINISGVKLKLFFSYGEENLYTKIVKDCFLRINAEVIEDFLPREEFNQLYDEASALVINSYRQHAGANIFMAINKGCKIYLNPKTTTYSWLKSEGFIISSVYDLPKDIQNNNFALSQENQFINIAKYRELQNKNTPQSFQDNLIKIMKQ